MKTVTVSSIVTNAASRAGLDGSSIDNLPTTTKTIMVDNLSSATFGMPGNFMIGPICAAPKSARCKPEWTRTFISTSRKPARLRSATCFRSTRTIPNTHAAPREIQLLPRLRQDPPSFSDCPDTIYVRFRLPATEISTVLATALAQTVPQILADYLKFSLTGDLLTEDGQLDKAQVMYGRAELSLVKETEKFTFQQKQTRRWTASVSQY
jgi:hypothetical protein